MGLIITRKQGESIRVNKDTLITIRRLSGNRVSLDIYAPKEVQILRTELEASQTNAFVPMRGARKIT